MSGAKKKFRAAFVPEADVLDRLHALVTARRDADPRRSHSARLLARGTRKVAQKLGEEAFEALIESVAGNKRALVGESADLLYHLVVLWVDVGVSPDQVWAELRQRHGVSGHVEKASRVGAVSIEGSEENGGGRHGPL